MSKTRILILAAAATLAAGCATQPPPKNDNADLVARVERAERAAADAQAAAARAQARADEAASMAQTNVQKIDRAFTKSQQK